ncbi:MAG: hypothetical protein ACREYC_28100, partial [Gammaproteobacteria bacterium]
LYDAAGQRVKKLVRKQGGQVEVRRGVRASPLERASAGRREQASACDGRLPSPWPWIDLSTARRASRNTGTSYWPRPLRTMWGTRANSIAPGLSV